MQLTDYVVALTGRSFDALFSGGPNRAVLFGLNEDGSPTVKAWDETVTGKPKPSDSDLAAALKEPDVLPVPASVPAYQFAGQAAAEGIIPMDQARAWAGAGAVPPDLQAAVDKAITDPDQHDRVTLFLIGATEFPRYHPNTITLGAVFGKDTPAKLDAFFVAAAQR